MNVITDLRLADCPTMTLVLADEEGTTVHVCAPTVDLVNELRRSSAKLTAVLNGEEGDSLLKKAVYELAAKLINCNEDGFTTDYKELAVRYRVSLRALQKFFDDYVLFLRTIETEKN